MAALYEKLSARPYPKYVELQWSYKERFSYKVNAYLYQYKRVYQECMNHYKLWLQVSVTKTHAYKTNIAAYLHRCALLRNSYCGQRCYTTTTNYGYPHPQIPSL